MWAALPPLRHGRALAGTSFRKDAHANARSFPILERYQITGREDFAQVPERHSTMSAER